MAEKITHLHLSCHLLTVELFSRFMMAAILDKSALTGNCMNLSRIAVASSKRHLLHVRTTFKLMIYMNCIKEEAQIICFL